MTTKNVRRLITLNPETDKELSRLAGLMNVPYGAVHAMSLVIGMRSIAAGLEPDKHFSSEDVRALELTMGKMRAAQVTDADKAAILLGAGVSDGKSKRRRAARKG
jgi:hypothetical protein